MTKVFALLSCVALAGCVTTGTTAVVETRLPPIPAGITSCLNHLVPAPTRGDKAAVVRLIAELRRNDVAKTRCGKRLIAFYESIAKGLSQ